MQPFVQGSTPPRPVDFIISLTHYRFTAVMRLYYGKYKDFNDCAIRLMRNYNTYELSATANSEDDANKRMQYRDAVKVLTVRAYHDAVNFFSPGKVHKHLTVLGLSFVEAAYFFGGEFRDECFTGPNKPRQRHDKNLVRSNGEGHKTAMEELLTTKEGIDGHFYMDVDILSTVYLLVADQLRFKGDFPRGRHVSAKSWNKAYEQAVSETVDKIRQQMFCQKKKLGRPYPVCLRDAGYLDHAFPLPTDDPQYRPPGPYREDWAGTPDEEEEGAGAGGGNPDVVVEEEYEIEMVYDSMNDPQAACNQATSLPEKTPAQGLAELLKSSVSSETPPKRCQSRRSTSGGDSGNLSTDTKMKEAMGDLSLSADLAG